MGSYAQGANSTLAIEVAPTGASQLKSLGAASLNGKLALSFDQGSYAPHLYTLVAASSLSGTFSSVTVGGSPGSLYGVAYSPTQVDLVVEPSAPAQVYGGLSTAALDRAQGFASLVEDRFGDAGCADGTADRKEEACRGMNAWAQAVGATGHLSGSAGAFGFNNTSAGFLGGIDRRRLDGSALGLAFGYEGDDLSMSGASAKASGGGYFGALYGRWVVGRAWLDGQAFFMHSDWTVKRRVASFGTGRSKPGGDTEGFLLQASAPLHDGDLRPYVRVTWAQFDRAAVAETGLGALDFTIRSSRNSSTLAEAGLLFAHNYEVVNVGEVRPQLQFGVQDALGDRARKVQVGLAGFSGTSSTVASAPGPEVAGVIDASIKRKRSLAPTFSNPM